MRKLAGVVVFLVAVSLSAAPPPVKIKGKGFGKLKNLVGNWTGTNKKGQTVRASYRLVSNDTAILEVLHSPESSEMVTLYYRNGDHLMLTHFCSEDNQPRMRTVATPGPDKSLDFSFVDVTNLDSPNEGHMRGVSITFEDDDHFTQKWTWREKGRETTEVFRFTRKK